MAANATIRQMHAAIRRMNGAVVDGSSTRNGAGMYTKRLSEITHSARLLKSERTMRGDAHVVVDHRVRTELRAALPPRPLLSGGNQRASDPLPSSRRRHIPALEIADVAAAAAVDDVADRQLGKSNGLAGAVERDEHFSRLAPVAGEKPTDLTLVPRGVGPELTSHAAPRLAVARRDRSNAHHCDAYSTSVRANDCHAAVSASIENAADERRVMAMPQM